jgi:hypothetical protein
MQEDGQLTLHRFSKKERRAIAKARKKSKKIESGLFCDLYFNGMFPRAMTCHRNSQLMALHSGLQLTYNEGWVLYRTRANGEGVGICYHAWNEYEDGTVLDTTWDFEFYPITQMSLGTAQNTTDRLKLYYAAGDRGVFNRTPPASAEARHELIRGFINFHGDNFFFCQEEALYEALYEDGDDSRSDRASLTAKVLKTFKASEVFNDVGYVNAKNISKMIFELISDHKKHSVSLRATIMKALEEAGVVQVTVNELVSEKLINEQLLRTRELMCRSPELTESKGVWSNMI